MEHFVETPVSDEEVKSFVAGDILYLSGRIFTARDMAHKRMLVEGVDFSTEGLALYHCGPLVQENDEGWRVVSAGPTTSPRMDIFEADFIERFGIRIIIGKGGMGDETRKALQKHGAIYAVFTGGAGALAAHMLEKVHGVYFQELGMAEAVWLFEANRFGPLVVAMDCHGGSLFEEVSNKSRDSAARLMDGLETRDRTPNL